MNKKALVLAGGIAQIKMIRHLKSRGYRVLLADYTDAPVAVPFADEFFQESTLDVDAIRRIAVREHVDLIITCCTDQALNTVSLLSEELGLPCCTDADTGLAVTNKILMKERFVSFGIPTAPFATVHKDGEYPLVPFPAVVKPADCNSSKGVVKVFDEASLRKAVDRARDMSRTRTALVEEFVEGVELSIDCFVKNGDVEVLCISRSEKIAAEDSFVICRGVYEPARHARNFDQAKEIAERIVRAFSLKNCPLLVQVLANGSDLKVVEFSARTGGCIKHHLIELASGIDVVELVVGATLGETLEIAPAMSGKVIADEFLYCEPGVLGCVSGLDECKAEGTIENFFVLKSPGVSFDGVSSSGDRAAAVTIVADSVTDYKAKLERLASRVDVLSKDGRSILRRDLLLAETR